MASGSSQVRELQQVECVACAKASRCGLKFERCRLVLMAWAHDSALEGCPEFVLRCYHGLDGVADTLRSPFGFNR